MQRSSQPVNSLFERRPPDLASIHIWRLALSIENDTACIEAWYRSVPIRELGGLTAQQLVSQGNSTLVIGFLRSIRSGERD